MEKLTKFFKNYRESLELDRVIEELHDLNPNFNFKMSDAHLDSLSTLFGNFIGNHINYLTKINDAFGIEDLLRVINHEKSDLPESFEIFHKSKTIFFKKINSNYLLKSIYYLEKCLSLEDIIQGHLFEKSGDHKSSDEKVEALLRKLKPEDMHTMISFIKKAFPSYYASEAQILGKDFSKKRELLLLLSEKFKSEKIEQENLIKNIKSDGKALLVFLKQ